MARMPSLCPACSQPLEVSRLSCPGCQMNLEGFQGAAGRHQKRDLTMDILYLPQLLGIALGIEERELGLKDNLALKRRWMDRLPPAPDAPLPLAAGNG